MGSMGSVSCLSRAIQSQLRHDQGRCHLPHANPVRRPPWPPSSPSLPPSLSELWPGGGEVDLLEDEDEAAGDRIVDDMNGMKEKFDIALKRIGDEIDKDQKEQDEKGAIE